jgi:hypothetical protein
MQPGHQRRSLLVAIMSREFKRHICIIAGQGRPDRGDAQHLGGPGLPGRGPGARVAQGLGPCRIRLRHRLAGPRGHAGAVQDGGAPYPPTPPLFCISFALFPNPFDGGPLISQSVFASVIPLLSLIARPPPPPSLSFAALCSSSNPHMRPLVTL